MIRGVLVASLMFAGCDAHSDVIVCGSTAAVGWNDATSLGFSAQDVADAVSARAYTSAVTTYAIDGATGDLSENAPFDLTFTADGTASLLTPTQDCAGFDGAALEVPVHVEITSGDGALSVDGSCTLTATATSDDAISLDCSGLSGTLPTWMQDAANGTQSGECTSAPAGDPAVNIGLGGTLAAPWLDGEARYQEVGVCQYVTTLATLNLSP